MTTDREEFVRLVGLVHDLTKHLSPYTSALQLYRDARDVAEQRLPGPLGVAVASVLAEEAHGRAGMRGCLGASKPAMALAIAVLQIAPDAVGAESPDGRGSG